MFRLPTEAPVDGDQDILVRRNPEFEGKLNFLADQIAAAVNESDPPARVAAITGSWGSGKTSAANLVVAKVQARLRAMGIKCSVANSIFNAQANEVSGRNELRYRLAVAILRALPMSVLGDIETRFSLEASSATVTIAMRIGAIARQFVDLDQHAFVRFERDLASIVRESLGGMPERPPVVVVVDDLDRCATEYAAELLRAVARWSELAGATFILASAYSTLEDAAHEASRGLSDLPIVNDAQEPSSPLLGRGTTPLDKFVHLVVEMPNLIPTATAAAEYLSATFGLQPDDRGLAKSDLSEDRVLAGSAEGTGSAATTMARFGDEKTAVEEGQGWLLPVTQQLALGDGSSVLRPLIEKERNPRHLKKAMSQVLIELVGHRSGTSAGTVSNLKSAVISAFWKEDIAKIRDYSALGGSNDLATLLATIYAMPVSARRSTDIIAALQPAIAPQLPAVDSLLLSYLAEAPLLADLGFSEGDIDRGSEPQTPFELDSENGQWQDQRSPSAQVRTGAWSAPVDSSVVQMQDTWTKAASRVASSRQSGDLEELHRMVALIAGLWQKDRRSVPTDPEDAKIASIGNGSLDLEAVDPALAFVGHQIAVAAQPNVELEVWPNSRLNFVDFIADLFRRNAINEADRDKILSDCETMLGEVADRRPNYRRVRQKRSRNKLEDVGGPITPQILAERRDEARELAAGLDDPSDIRDCAILFSELELEEYYEDVSRAWVERPTDWLTIQNLHTVIRSLADIMIARDDNLELRISLYAFIIGSRMASHQETADVANAAHNLSLLLTDVESPASSALVLALLAYSLNPDDTSIRRMTSRRLAENEFADAAVAALSGADLLLGDGTFPYGVETGTVQGFTFETEIDAWWLACEPANGTSAFPLALAYPGRGDRGPAS